MNLLGHDQNLMTDNLVKYFFCFKLKYPPTLYRTSQSQNCSKIYTQYKTHSKMNF